MVACLRVCFDCLMYLPFGSSLACGYGVVGLRLILLDRCVLVVVMRLYLVVCFMVRCWC